MITRDAVTWGYRLILGREPESESVVDAHASIKDIETFRKVLFNSIEFARSNLTARLPSRWVAAPVMDGRRLIWVDLSDSFVSRGCLFDNYEPEETRFVRNFLKQGDTFVDIGANIGWFTLVASTMVGDCGTIHAFEPRAITGDYLERSIEINGLHKQVRVHRYGLSDAEGHAYLTWAQNTANPGGSFLSADASRAGMEYQSVRLQALDHLGLERVDFMKVDVEGAEMRVFRGARATIERSRPVILSELSPEMLKRVSGVPVRTFFDFFQALGYRCFIVDKQRCGEEVVEFPEKWHKELINLGLVPAERDPAIFLSHLALHPDTGWPEQAQMRPTDL